jgi:hypothetical protein
MKKQNYSEEIVVKDEAKETENEKNICVRALYFIDYVVSCRLNGSGLCS